MMKGRLTWLLWGELAAWGPLWTESVCWSSVWACLCRHDKEGETKVRLARLCPMGLKHTEGWTPRLGGGAESHRLCEGVAMKRSLHKGKIWVRMRGTDGQEERGGPRQWQKKGGEAVSPSPSSLRFPASSAGLAVPHFGTERDYQTPAWGLIGTRSLPPPLTNDAAVWTQRCLIQIRNKSYKTWFSRKVVKFDGCSISLWACIIYIFFL